MAATAPAQPPTRGQLAARSLSHPLARLLLVLTWTTGLVDAVSYLGLGRVFAANMTGNVVLLGFGVAGSGGLPVLAPVVALVAFLAGAGAGGLLGSRTAARHAVHVAAALGIEALLLAVATLLALVADPGAGTVTGGVVVVLLAFGMGIRNATVRRFAVPDLTTTVLTLTLTGLAADSRPAGGSGSGTARRIAAVTAMLLGALVGALLLRVDLAVPLAVATVTIVAATLLYLRAAGRETRPQGPPPRAA